MTDEIYPPDRWDSFGLAFVGGFGDAAGFVLAKTFTGHVTGSLVLGAIAMAGHDWRGIFAHFSATASFLAGIPLSVVIGRNLASSRLLLPTALAIEATLISTAYFVLAFHLAGGVEIFVACASLALGLQNGVFRRTADISVHTTYLTGLITGLLAREMGGRASSLAPRSSGRRDQSAGLLYGIWGMFLLGAATGAASVLHFNERGILPVLIVLIGLIVRNLLTTPQLAWPVEGKESNPA